MSKPNTVVANTQFKPVVKSDKDDKPVSKESLEIDYDKTGAICVVTKGFYNEYGSSNIMLISKNMYDKIVTFIKNRNSAADTSILFVKIESVISGDITRTMVTRISPYDDKKDNLIYTSRIHRENLFDDAILKEGMALRIFNVYRSEICHEEKLVINIEPHEKGGLIDLKLLSDHFKKNLNLTVFNRATKNTVYLNDGFDETNKFFYYRFSSYYLYPGMFKYRGLLTEKTEINFEGNCVVKDMFKINQINFEKIDVGGVDKQFTEIFRRVFLTRLIPKQVYDKLGMPHIRGVLMHGPPGTGKTRLARSIGKVLNCEEPMVVNGPELFSKWVGESEAAVRRLFEKPEKNPDKLYMIIFDEFDALCKSRGTGSSAGASDNVVTQLLSKIDGYNVMNNVILIAITNRKDLIDEAALRPGRFEVHIYIGLADQIGREQIFKIHTKKLVENKLLDTNIDVSKIGKLTENMTGAEIEGIIKDATTRAIGKHVSFDNLDEARRLKSIMVMESDILGAISSCKPLFGTAKDRLSKLLEKPYNDFNDKEYGNFVLELTGKINKFAGDEKTQGVYSICLTGPSGAGKTFLSAFLTKNAKATFKNYICANDVVGQSENQKVSQIMKIINNAKECESSVVIIDDIEIMLEWTPQGRYSNLVLQTIKTILGGTDKGKMLIILNSSHYDAVKELSVFERVDHVGEIPLINDMVVKKLIKN